MPVSGLGAAVEAKNAIRTSIKSLFPDRDCATLVRPMHDELVREGQNHIVAIGCLRRANMCVSRVLLKNAVLHGNSPVTQATLVRLMHDELMRKAQGREVLHEWEPML
jgi:hypothetical protein